MSFSVPLLTDRLNVLTRSRDCSPRPWSLLIIFYVSLIFSAGALPFILGRVINISTRSEHQLDDYTESTIWGDLSESDIAAADAQLGAFTVSLLPFHWCESGNLTSQGVGLRAHLDISFVHGSIFVADSRAIEIRRRQRVFCRVDAVATSAQWVRFRGIRAERNDFG